LALARRNAERHQVDQRMQFVPSDLMAEVPAGQRFDFIVSNPPYIPTGEIRHLPVGVRDFEPHLALDGGPTGYEVTIRLIDQARWRLAPGGWLLLETGAQQAEKVVEALRRHPEYGGPAVIQDYAGHPRVVRVGLAAS
ncbi:MAG TPA: methyltransferase, partial [Gemmatales bacterium]|nr:methyltransferase [Gemmatales bacterium]